MASNNIEVNGAHEEICPGFPLRQMKGYKIDKARLDIGVELPRYSAVFVKSCIISREGQETRQLIVILLSLYSLWQRQRQRQRVHDMGVFVLLDRARCMEGSSGRPICLAVNMQKRLGGGRLCRSEWSKASRAADGYACRFLNLF